ncbi:hypothetical protein SASPL_152447 [Salvia splendens]|uniref:Disease resistance protein RPM1 n=2 Tax=Salvia splendens TaxID=180675 RepID=A0A8X8W363_SALSN|nr:hypothetical protein SASPL_152447 [Salvia splendens]
MLLDFSKYLVGTFKRQIVNREAEIEIKSEKMAEAAVEFLLENLKQLLIHHADLIKNARSQVEKLEQDVGFFKSFLKKVSSKKLRKDETLKALVREIRSVFYDADDAIDTMVRPPRRRPGNQSPDYSTSPSTKTSATQRGSMKSAKGSLTSSTATTSLTSSISPPPMMALTKTLRRLTFFPIYFPTPSKKDNVVGLEDEANKIVGYLKENTSHLDVISIIGMLGLGKTTLAGNIFHDPDIKFEFTEKEVFLSSLRQMKTQFNKDEYTKKRCSYLAKETSALLGDVGKFLLVMDDVWETTDWDKIKECLPEDNTVGKVMITSRQMDVGKHVNRFREPHPLRKEIAARCDGLPLAIVVIEGVLATKLSKSETQWEKVSTSADGRVKSCRIHDMLRDFCKVEGWKDCDTKKLSGPVMKGFSPHSLKHRSIDASASTRMSWTSSLLRVLEAKPLKFSRLPKSFHELFHLRYLALSMKPESNSTPSVLPSTFKKLWNIQTLIVDTTSRFLDIRADVMSMTQLSTVSPESCTEALFDRARNLKKLGMRGKLSSFLNSKTGTFDCLTKLSYLEKLKLLNDVYPKPPSLGKLDSLPPAYKFPVNLRSLTLQNTFLEWTHMSTLGSLQKLKVLKLKDNAFVGTSWEVMERGFNALEVLHIRRIDLLTWTASAQHFPSLKQLQLRNCDKLKEVPIGLNDNPNLEYLDLQFCKAAAASAKKLAAAKKAGATTFTLSIYPPNA